MKDKVQYCYIGYTMKDKVQYCYVGCTMKYKAQYCYVCYVVTEVYVYDYGE